MSTRLACVVIDAERPRSTADFWAELLGWSVTVQRDDQVDVAAPDPEGAELTLVFTSTLFPATQRPKTGKNRVHLDLASRSLDHQRMLIDRALVLGARAVDIGQGPVPWAVLADPAGNEFCVLEPREEYVDTGALAAVVIDTADPPRLAEFWARAAGWPPAHRDGRVTGLRSATGLGCWLEFVPTAHPKSERNRLRLDVTAMGDPADPAVELARLCAEGARAFGDEVVNFGSATRNSLADPEANEFFLLHPGADRSTV